MGLVQACTLRDVLREVGPDRLDELALSFAEAVEAIIGPLYRMTVAQDRNRMAEIQADIAGTPQQRSDATWNLQRALERLMLQDADALRVVMRHVHHFEPFDPAGLPPALRAKIDALAVEAPHYPVNGPTRAELLAAVAGGSTQNLA
jgi:hypothetical protein